MIRLVGLIAVLDLGRAALLGGNTNGIIFGRALLVAFPPHRPSRVDRIVLTIRRKLVIPLGSRVCLATSSMKEQLTESMYFLRP